jgi:hypothetical protein
VLGHVAALVVGLGDVDLGRGRGVLGGNDRCLWRKDGRRIDVSVTGDGSVIASCEK